MKVYDLNLPENSSWREMFEKYRFDVMLNTEIRSSNFRPNEFNIDKQLGSFLMFDEVQNRIAGICSVYTPPHWPKTVARLYNRSFVDPNYRLKGLSKSNSVSNLGKGRNLGKLCHQYAYGNMVAVCKKNGITLGVATRENTGKSNSIMVMCRCACDKDPNWTLSERYFLTAPSPEKAVCWQRLIYIEFVAGGANHNLSQIPNISQDEYKERFL
jgi:hypothetical protein